MAKTRGKSSKKIPATGKKGLAVSTSPAPDMLVSKFPYFLLAISSLIVLYTRIRLLSIPMERDEAGFAYIGHWLLQGKSLYTDMVDNKLPGLYFLYGLFTTVFGYNATGVHIGLLLCNIVSAVCFYFLLKKLFSSSLAALATAFMILMLAGQNVIGFAAHATQLLLPFALGGFLLMWQGLDTGKKYLFLLAGLSLGMAFMVKQQSVVFGIMAALLWWVVRLKQRSVTQRLPILEWLLLGIGGLLPVTLTAVYFKMTGRWDDLFFWAYQQPAGMAKTFTMSRWEIFSTIFPKVVEGYIVYWIMAVAGMILIWKTRNDLVAKIFAVLLFLAGFVSVIIGAAFYHHYFILALPGVAILCAVVVDWLMNRRDAFRIGGIILACILLLWPLVHWRQYFFFPDHTMIHHQSYGQNMFPEIERLGKDLARRAPRNSRIGIMGSEPGLLVAAEREGCSRHLFMYPLLSDPETSPALQQEYLEEMKSCMPEYIVFNTSTGSWANGYNQIQMFQQLMQWVEYHYATVGLAEYRPGQPGVIVWDNEVSTHVSQSPYKVYVLKRKK